MTTGLAPATCPRGNNHSGPARALYFAGLGLFTFAILWIDGASGTRLAQALLGAAALGVLFAVLRLSPAHERRETWFCVGYSTLIELLATQLWGLYGYRLGNVPLYVPPGHGLIFAVSLQASRTDFLRAHGFKIAKGALAIATVWAALGLVLPLLKHRAPDVHGALYWPFFAIYMLRSPKAPIYAVTFLVTSLIEIVGVLFGNWHWAAEMPYLGVPSADPPSLIAGGYCSFAEVAVILASWRWLGAPAKAVKIGS
jgi:hypothetical protein